MGQVSSSQRADFAQSNHNHNNNSISSLSLSRLSREQHNQQSSPRNVDHPFHRRHRSTGGIDSTVERSHASPLLTSRSAASPLPSVTTNPDIDMFRNSSDLDFHPSLRADSPVGTMERLGSHYSSSTLETTAAIPASATNRQSTMSRLGSRILPNAVVRGLLNSGEETPAEGRAHRIGSMDTHMEFGGSRELDSVEPSTRNTLQMSTSTPSRPPRTSSPARRHTPSRSRHIRSIRRDEQTPLSRVLQMAAAAIAAQLSGNTPPAMPNIQAIGADGADGSLESFIQSLQQATSTQTQGIGTEDESGSNQRDGGLPHVNFLRVFRFVNPENTESNSTTGHPNQPGSEYTQDSGSDRMDLDDPTPTDNSQDRRLVTLVVVGVRFSSHRRSMGSNTFPANYDSQRHQRSHTSSRNQSNLANSLPTVLSESPPGPHPPPSTPADPGLSNVSSEANSPSRRPSASSVALPQLNEDSSQEPDESSENHHPLFNNVRQRRRSDSETARHRGLGSGAARRNGVVEPDSTSPSAGRSWLIYVVGTNLSENHPAFATPSLFTDNPTYEDMLLLSSLLGPAKPPVASQEDVASAGGIYRLVEYDGSLIAESADTTQKILITENERCLICLSEYEAAEEVRQLTKCHHLYHRECIDEWLTTGRNSCPLCRGQGVSNSESNDPGTTNEQETVS
ncbi:RING finger domain-containing protein [Histoplasma capsulatum G186AR]|uniref:RING finger domain-containing protein n=1 Tax=Ajellomyces capsulatus (strain G186AR / H82 / ATCC MYA-2454 / RMSCC 2432) TaxID=447093 RepID=C0NVH4_AJECG|nr:RING finger domain-containing protein [Histoplasma capsulatum G186AR]EEH04513.1 RING finger domain-containing protein [Histoplasma capsulatum G186AR]